MNATYRGRVRTGCQACRTSKVRCDEQYPVCKRCTRRQKPCIYTKGRTLDAVPAMPGNANESEIPSNPWKGLSQPLDRCSAHSRSPGTEMNLHCASSVHAVETPSTSVRSPSVISSLISQNIWICSTIDLLAANEGSNKASLAHFRQTVESPFITPYDAANWVVFKDSVLECASHNAAVAFAVLAVQELYKARKNCLSEGKALPMYRTACEMFEEVAISENASNNVDVVLMAVFVLSLFEMLLPQYASEGPLAKSHGSLNTRLETWCRNEDAHTLLSLRVAAWLLISHAAARRSGNPGLLSGTVRNLLASTCSKYPQLPPLETGPNAPLSSHLVSALSSPLFMFYFRLQLLSTRVADLSHYHRSRTTGADQEEVSNLMSSVQEHIAALWKDRPTLLRHGPSDLREQLASTVAEPLVLLTTLCHLTYHTELVEIGRNLSDSQRASTEAKAHMAEARKMISSVERGVGLANFERLYVHPAYLRTLFLYAIESFDEADTLWAVSRMRDIKDPICYSEFFATFAEGLTAEQRAKGRRVTTKWWCWQSFGVTPPYL